LDASYPVCTWFGRTRYKIHAARKSKKQIVFPFPVRYLMWCGSGHHGIVINKKFLEVGATSRGGNAGRNIFGMAISASQGGKFCWVQLGPFMYFRASRRKQQKARWQLFCFGSSYQAIKIGGGLQWTDKN